MFSFLKNYKYGLKWASRWKKDWGRKMKASGRKMEIHIHYFTGRLCGNEFSLHIFHVTGPGPNSPQM